MGVDIARYRESIGRHYYTSLTIGKKCILSLDEIIGINLMVLYGLRVLPVIILIFVDIRSKCNVRNRLVTRTVDYDSTSSGNFESSTCIDIYDTSRFLLFVLCILLIISGIEMNPGPSHSDISTSTDYTDILSDSSSVGSPNISHLVANSFSFLQLNIQSIVPKLDLITAEYSSHEILSFTESWLKPITPNDELEIPGYKPPLRKDRLDRVGGGVIIYVKDNVVCNPRSDIQTGIVEGIWVELKLKNKKYLYGTFYIPPNSNQLVWDDFERSIDQALNSNLDVIITGDFNINQFGHNTSKLDNILVQFGLHQLITEPTYVTENGSSLLDLVLVSNPHSILLTEVGPPLLNQTRYHLPTVGVLSHPHFKQKSFQRKVFIFNRADFNSYRQHLSNVDWDPVFDQNQVDLIATKVTKIITDAADNCIPNRTITVRKDRPPWLTTNLLRTIRRKNRLHRKAKKCDTPHNWQRFREARNQCNRKISNAKASYFCEISEKIKLEKSGSKNWWSLVKSLVGNTVDRSIRPLEHNGDIIFDDTKKAELLNVFFSEQSNLDDANVNPPNIPIMQVNRLNQISITESDVEDILSSLDTSKATGPDLINPRLLKEASSVLKYPLCRLFNLSLSESIYPSIWKNANVAPVFKKDDPSNVKNYRPISLISILGKVMERCVFKYLHNHLLENSIITCHQSGFTKGDSAINQLLFMTNEFGKALDDGKEIRVVFCDISKAFDRVWHKGLLCKLQSIGICGSLLAWIKNYLNNRKQRVVINGNFSQWTCINAGVPQGSILGPLLFIIYINDIVRDIQSTIKLFADDTSLYLIIDNPIDSATLLNGDLSKIHEWSMNWLVKFNPQKTETMTISRKINRPIHPPLFMNNSNINIVNEHKHLGLIFSDDGSWNKHLDMITKKAYARINILRKFKFILDRKTLEKIYLTFIRPLLEYGDVVWDHTSPSLIKKIENVQLEAARIVTGGTRLVSIARLYTETGWEPLKERREHHRITYFYKMCNGLTPSFLSDLVPRNLREIHDYNTRHSSVIPPIRTRTALYSNYFLPQTVRSWNSLPDTCKNSSSLNSFKQQFLNADSAKPSYYCVGNRLGQIYHARLRMDCSSLNSHLYRKNIVDSPNCICGDQETTTHFFFNCPRHNALRHRFIFSLTPPVRLTTNILLFGSDELTIAQNTDIFLSVQKFILSSKRFTINANP